MIDFLTANWASLLVLAVVILIIGAVVLKMIKDKKQGKSSCACGCDSCPSAGLCHTKK